MRSITRRVSRRSQPHFRELMEATEDGVAEVAPDGRIVAVNQRYADILGFAAGDLVGRVVGEVVGRELVRAARDYYTAHRGCTGHREAVVRRADGEARWVRYRAVELTGGGWLALATDVTELRRAEEVVRLETAREEHAWREALMRLARAVEFRDEETGEHVTRMAELSALLGRRLGLGPEHCERLRLAATLHDAGKVAIPDRILYKPGPLDAAERAVVETHPEVGRQLLSGSGNALLELAATIAWTHHERVDGSGYPRGLIGDAIPLEGRIAAVADVFDALTSDRPYRAAMSVEAAAAVLQDGRGRAFDAAVVDALLGAPGAAVEVKRRFADAPVGVGGAARAEPARVSAA